MNRKTAEKKLRSNYDKLKGHERFIMILKANQRGDEAERTVLVDSCPRYSYTMTDRKYQLCFDTAQRIGDMAILDVMSRMMLIYQLFTLIGDAATSEADDREQPAEMIISALKLLNEAAIIWTAFKAFCEDIGAPLEQFLIYSSYGLEVECGRRAGEKPITVTAFEYGLNMIELAEPDPAQVEAWRKQFYEFWQWGIGESEPLDPYHNV